MTQQRNLIVTLSSLWLVLSVLGYGLRLTAKSQIDLWKLGRVENDDISITLETTTYALTVTKPVMLESAPMQITQKADQVKAPFFGVAELPHHPLYKNVTAT